MVLSDVSTYLNVARISLCKRDVWRMSEPSRWKTVRVVQSALFRARLTSVSQRLMHDDSRRMSLKPRRKQFEPGRTPSVSGKEDKEVGNRTTTKKPC